MSPPAPSRQCVVTKKALGGCDSRDLMHAEKVLRLQRVDLDLGTQAELTAGYVARSAEVKTARQQYLLACAFRFLCRFYCYEGAQS